MRFCSAHLASSFFLFICFRNCRIGTSIGICCHFGVDGSLADFSWCHWMCLCSLAFLAYWSAKLLNWLSEWALVFMKVMETSLVWASSIRRVHNIQLSFFSCLLWVIFGSLVCSLLKLDIIPLQSVWIVTLCFAGRTRIIVIIATNSVLSTDGQSRTLVWKKWITWSFCTSN